jgi:hypothetical protein
MINNLGINYIVGGCFSVLEEEFTDNTLEETKYFKDKGCCVRIMCFAKCEYRQLLER